MIATQPLDTDIRPISDLRNKFAEIADYVQGGNTVIFTRNGYGCMVTMSFDAYKHLNDPVIGELNRADALCESDTRHYTRAQSLKILKERRDARSKGWTLVTTPLCRFALLNLMGRIFMNPSDCPFRTADACLNEMPKDVPVFVDFHAEATSEKITLGHYLDGRVTAVAGTHTHVQTSDAFVLPKGTAYITDLGMCGPYVSSIGRNLKPALRKFLTGMPSRFDIAEGPATLEGAVITFDQKTKMASSIEAIRVREPYAG